MKRSEVNTFWSSQSSPNHKVFSSVDYIKILPLAISSQNERQLRKREKMSNPLIDPKLGLLDSSVETQTRVL